jgi:hypothetical protein
MQERTPGIQETAQFGVSDGSVARAAVEIVPHDGVARVRKVHAELVGTARRRSEPD